MTRIFQYTESLEEPTLAGLPLQPDEKWYFWAETWADAYGPYESKEEAYQGAIRYGREVLGVKG